MAYKDIEMWKQILESQEKDQKEYLKACNEREKQAKRREKLEFDKLDEDEIDLKTLGMTDSEKNEIIDEIEDECESIDFSAYQLDEADMREPLTQVSNMLDCPASTASLIGQDKAILAESSGKTIKDIIVEMKKFYKKHSDGKVGAISNSTLSELWKPFQVSDKAKPIQHHEYDNSSNSEIFDVLKGEDFITIEEYLNQMVKDNVSAKNIKQFKAVQNNTAYDVVDCITYETKFIFVFDTSKKHNFFDDFDEEQPQSVNEDTEDIEDTENVEISNEDKAKLNALANKIEDEGEYPLSDEDWEIYRNMPGDTAAQIGAKWNFLWQKMNVPGITDKQKKQLSQLQANLIDLLHIKKNKLNRTGFARHMRPQKVTAPFAPSQQEQSETFGSDDDADLQAQRQNEMGVQTIHYRPKAKKDDGSYEKWYDAPYEPNMLDPQAGTELATAFDPEYADRAKSTLGARIEDFKRQFIPSIDTSRDSEMTKAKKKEIRKNDLKLRKYWRDNIAQKPKTDIANQIADRAEQSGTYNELLPLVDFVRMLNGIPKKDRDELMNELIHDAETDLEKKMIKRIFTNPHETVLQDIAAGAGFGTKQDGRTGGLTEDIDKLINLILILCCENLNICYDEVQQMNKLLRSETQVSRDRRKILRPQMLGEIMAELSIPGEVPQPYVHGIITKGAHKGEEGLTPDLEGKRKFDKMVGRVFAIVYQQSSEEERQVMMSKVAAYVDNSQVRKSKTQHLDVAGQSDYQHLISIARKNDGNLTDEEWYKLVKLDIIRHGKTEDQADDIVADIMTNPDPDYLQKLHLDDTIVKHFLRGGSGNANI